MMLTQPLDDDDEGEELPAEWRELREHGVTGLAGHPRLTRERRGGVRLARRNDSEDVERQAGDGGDRGESELPCTGHGRQC